jgi:hypothetical protein
MTYVTADDRNEMRQAPATRCVCGHWAAVHVTRHTQVCTVNACICDNYLAHNKR